MNSIIKGLIWYANRVLFGMLVLFGVGLMMGLVGYLGYALINYPIVRLIVCVFIAIQIMFIIGVSCLSGGIND